MTGDGSVFGARLSGWRQLTGLSQEELAERSGLSVRAISNLERGRTRLPHPASVRRLADALDLHGAKREEFFAAAARQSTRPMTPGWTGPDVVPRQLPAAVSGFAGRPAELAELDRFADGAEKTGGAVVISAIGGTAGVGKTALAVYWAHRAADRFPDGQLYVNLRGFDPGGRITSSAEAVRGFLDALGVPPQRIPASLDAQAALYRSLLAGRRVLVMLDNARDTEQVLPLLPGTSTALAVVTSRNPLTSLVAAQGAHPLTLDLLTPAEARELLARRLGDDRVTAEPDAVDQIVTRCARLPLALTVVAARAAQSGFPLARLAGELAETGSRLDVLSAGDPVSDLRTVFSWSYTTLTPAAARLFRLLGLHPGPDISAAAAGSLTGCARTSTRALLAELAGASLLTEHAAGRYAFHDLLRAYAAALARSLDADGECDAATRRMLDHYLHTAYSAAQFLLPDRDPIPLPLAGPAPGVTPERLGDHGQAMTWFTGEQPILLAAVEQAADAGLDSRAWQLAWTLDTYLYRRQRDDLARTWQTALAAAGRLHQPTALAYAHRSLARAAAGQGRDHDVHAHQQRALELYTRAGDHTGQALVHQLIALDCERDGRPDRAIDHVQQSLLFYQAAGHLRGQAAALNLLGWYHAQLDQREQALAACQHALALHQQLGVPDGEACTWDSLGYIHHLSGDAQAADCYRRALDLFRKLGDRYQEAATLTRLGETHRASGDTAAARAAWQRALDILTDLGHPDADGLRERLDQPSLRDEAE